MNTSRKATEWLICFSIVNLMLGCLLFKKLKIFCHFKTRIEEHIKKDNKSHIFKHSTATCFDSYNSLCFKIIDKANSNFDLKIKEALHINRRKPNLNAQQNHLALTYSL